MKWTYQDTEIYEKSKEYVDTAIIPLIPVAGGKEQKDSVLMGEFAQYLSDYIERQYMGRVYLLPPFTYLKEEEEKEKQKRVLEWSEHFKKEGFEYFLFITSDMEWRQIDLKKAGELVWVPAFSLSDMESKKRQQSVEQQARQIIPLMTKKWK
ncbi:YpiF family protein [Alkalicoccus halolimnae]|uniref:YpiF family protein n=1 Tax=Alkalicoccus halolimnae TaxID=1667239 RepID=A0A5C7FH06_9BACI|nr:YpiF family protein [Alkalicoccus halolimnae]TXF82993.1 DUF2487 family protein [Alkalicoccus halolimnae]